MKQNDSINPHLDGLTFVCVEACRCRKAMSACHIQNARYPLAHTQVTKHKFQVNFCIPFSFCFEDDINFALLSDNGGQ